MHLSLGKDRTPCLSLLPEAPPTSPGYQSHTCPPCHYSQSQAQPLGGQFIRTWGGTGGCTGRAGGGCKESCALNLGFCQEVWWGLGQYMGDPQAGANPPPVSTRGGAGLFMALGGSEDTCNTCAPPQGEVGGGGSSPSFIVLLCLQHLAVHQHGGDEAKDLGDKMKDGGEEASSAPAPLHASTASSSTPIWCLPLPSPGQPRCRQRRCPWPRCFHPPSASPSHSKAGGGGGEVVTMVIHPTPYRVLPKQ